MAHYTLTSRAKRVMCSICRCQIFFLKLNDCGIAMTSALGSAADPLALDERQCYLLIRFHSDCASKCRVGIHSNIRSIHARKGHVLGLATRLEIAEGFWPLNTGLAVLYFPTIKSAVSWMEETPDVKEPNWIHPGLDVIAVPLAAATFSKRPLFVFQNTTIRDPLNRNKYAKEYISSLHQTRSSSEIAACLLVVAGSEVRSIRGRWETDLMLVHQFNNATDMRRWKDSQSHGQHRELLHILSQSIMTVIAALREIKDR
ncbi:hypothetical protein CAPTEDRAFT_210127 [Capitella teleta]|uniref:Uncharacterized protein n=1 Tax=Capitella teleta TaxID=283909 RepID=R7U3I6_CAPTE|nr:hypothetical protein CAPTEDRAFT_210127 [Capitella teleta]|eukprot:ELT97735.1 hypothetical protein CAPTEDRAFT_210127 [Capitella teleta]